MSPRWVDASYISAHSMIARIVISQRFFAPLGYLLIIKTLKDEWYVEVRIMY